jgi:hypothetical protein
MRGAGSSFGIATKLLMQTQAAPANGVAFTYSWADIKDDSVNLKTAVFSEMQDFAATTAPPELALRMWTLTNTFEIRGIYWGSRQEFEKVIAPLLQKWPKNPKVSIAERGWLESLSAFAGGAVLPQPEVYTQHGTFYAKSIVAPVKIKAAALNSFFDFLSSQRAKDSDVKWWVIAGEPHSIFMMMYTNHKHKILTEAYTLRSENSLSTRTAMPPETLSGRYSCTHTRPTRNRRTPRIRFRS